MTKLKTLPGRNNPCLCCPPILPTLKMNWRIAVGFGYAAVECGSKVIWSESWNMEWSELWTVQKAENLARKRKKGDWRIVLDGPMHGETYQRQGRNRWVLVKSNNGFA